MSETTKLRVIMEEEAIEVGGDVYKFWCAGNRFVESNEMLINLETLEKGTEILISQAMKRREERLKSTVAVQAGSLPCDRLGIGISDGLI